MKRIMQLRAADLPQLALQEIATLEDTQSGDLGLQLAKAQIYDQQGDTWNSVMTLSRAIPQYQYLELDQLPRQVWEILYPRRHWISIQDYGKKQKLDPMIVAGLIRQESLFNAGVKSKAQAYGLMQILPSTADFAPGLYIAKREGVGVASSN